MPDALQKFAEDTINELLDTLPPEKLLERLFAEKRAEKLSLDGLLAALPDETRAELARRLVTEPPKPGVTKQEPEEPTDS